MHMEGTFIFNGEKYPITGGHAWFDRQYGMKNQKNKVAKLMPGKSVWMWIGIPRLKNGVGTISLWDIYNKGEKYAYLTVVHEDGLHVNVDCDITYDEIWISEKTGFSYPRVIRLNVPKEEIKLELVCLSSGTGQEFVRDMKGLSGCQCLYRVTGTVQGVPHTSVVDIEMIGDLCGVE